MAAVLTQWEQTGIYDPLNPNQKSYLYYTQVPGGYGSFYYNKVPASAKLQGALGALATSDALTALVVGAVGIGLGFLGYRYMPGKVKAKLGLSGARRRRRR
jgi:hypothetical protein